MGEKEVMSILIALLEDQTGCSYECNKVESTQEETA